MRRMRFAPRGPLFNRGIVLTALVLALLLAPLPGTGLVKTAHARDEIEINITENMPIEDFLKTLSIASGQTIVWNPADKNVRGKTIVGSFALRGSTEKVMSLSRALLTFYELVMIPVGPGGADVLLVMDARQTSSILKLKPEHVVLTDENISKYENMDGFFITTTIKVEHMNDLRNARNALTRIVTGQNIGNVTEVPDAKAFVVTDFAPNVVAIYRLLREMDVPGAGSSTTTGETTAITLEHAAAVQLSVVLNSHYASSTRPQNPRQAPQVAGPRAPRITADERTNQLLLTGTKEQIQQVKKAIAMLDVPIAQPSEAAHLVRLTNINAQQAAVALQQLIAGSTLWAAPGPRGGSRPGVVAHSETNSLLITANQADFRVLKAILGDMDSKDLEEVEDGK